MRSSLMIRPYLRLLAVFTSWSLLVIALPTGSLSRATKAAPQASVTESASQESATDAATQAGVVAAYGNLPLSFEANLGQFDRRAHFFARGPGYGLFLTSSEAVMVLRKPAPDKESAPEAKPASAEQARINRAEREQERDAPAKGRTKAAQDAAPESITLRMKMEGANPSAQAEGLEELPGKTNYFVGNDPRQWHTNIPSYARVVYREVYPGVDLIYYGRRQQLEYDFVVGPGKDPGAIKLNFEGAQSVEVEAGGDLVLHTIAGDIRQQKPLVYQEVDGAKREILSRYVMKDRQRVGFQVDSYDTSKPLVIDPVMLYSTYLGGQSNDEGLAIAVDAAGNAYLAGRTSSFNFPVVNPTQSSTGSIDAFVSKLNPQGSALLYSTYLGGMRTDVARGIAIDAQGSAYVTGYTYSDNFPLMNPAQAALGGQDDPFATKLSPDGTALLYSTYLGGSGYEAGFGIAVDDAGEAQVTGFTYSHDFPLVNPFQATKAGHQAFKSTDHGDHWSASDTGLDASRMNDLVIDPAHPETLYAATEQGVFKSTDSGSTWHAANAGIEHTGDARRLAVDPAHTSTVFVGTDLGLFRSTNGGDTWAPNLAGGFFVSVQTIVFDPVNPSNVYTSIGGQLFKSTDGGDNWVHTPLLIGFFEVAVSALAISPNNSSIVYAGSSFSGIFKSTDGGAHWNEINTGLSPDLSFNVTELLINPANPSVIYASTDLRGVFKSTDGGGHWVAVNDGLPSRFIPTLALDPGQPSTIYAGTGFNGLFRSTNSGASWSPINMGLTNRAVRGIAVDPSDPSKVYVITNSLADAFVTKLNASGTARLYSTYLGGEEDDVSNGIALDGQSHAYLTGNTNSTNFPVENPLQASLDTDSFSDAFVTKLDATGSSLAYSTYLGGNSYDVGTDIAVDRGGNAYVTGYAEVADTPVTFPVTPGAFQTDFKGFIDVFVTKVNAAGSGLVYSTFIGGRALQYGYGIDVSPAGQAFVTGQTWSDDFPLVGAAQEQLNGLTDAFVSRLNAAGSALVSSTYLGGFGFSSEQGNGIAVDSASSAYVTGVTSSSSFPTTANAFQKFRAGGLDAFITKIGAPPPTIQISGKVFIQFSSTGPGVGGVVLTLTNRGGAVLQRTTTRSDGSYSFTVRGGGDYTITPSKPGYRFQPQSRSYINVGTDLPMQDFEALQSTINITFRVVGINGEGVGDVTINLSGTISGVCTTDFSDGSCTIRNLPTLGHYAVKPSRPGATFSPPSRTFSNLSHDLTIIFRAAYDISGRVTGFNGLGIGGVKVELSGDRHTFTTTDNHGNYKFTDLPAQGNYMVTPSKAGVTFDPPSTEFNFLRFPGVADFQAFVSISGKVRLEGTTMGISGVTVKLIGSVSATKTTNADGIYTFTHLPAAGNYTVKPMKQGYTFTPPSRTFTDLRMSQTPRTASFDGMP